MAVMGANMARGPANLNLARIVYRLLTSHRGWRVRDLMDQLGIAERTYRKYRQILQEEFTPFQYGDGSSRVHETGRSEDRWLKISEFEPKAVTQTDFPFAVAALAFCQQMHGFIDETPIGRAMANLVEEFNHNIKDRHFIVGHLLRNVDRIFRVVPSPFVDYTGQRQPIGVLVQALLFNRRVAIDCQGEGDERQRLVLEPLTLVHLSGTLKLLARRPGEPAVHEHSIADMEHCALLPERYEYPVPSLYHPDTYMEGCFGLCDTGTGQTMVVELVFGADSWLRQYVTQRRWHPTQHFTELPGQRLRMTFEVRSMLDVWPWIRSFGEDVTVIRPAMAVPRSRTEDRDDANLAAIRTSTGR